MDRPSRRGLAFRIGGLSLAACGWAALLTPFLPDGPAAPLVAAGERVVGLAPLAVGTGLALTLLGALDQGFAALDRFFAAALRRAQAAPPGGLIGERAYRVVPGGVEIDTALGPRRFRSLREARLFLGESAEAA